MRSDLRVLSTAGVALLAFRYVSLVCLSMFKDSTAVVRQLHHDLVAEQTVDLFEGESLGFGAAVPDRRHKHHGHDDEDEVVAPSDLGHAERETLEVGDRRQHEDGDAPTHSLCAQVGREDFRAVDVDGCVDEARETVIAKHKEHVSGMSGEYRSQAGLLLTW
jgi:hypothetical protein